MDIRITNPAISSAVQAAAAQYGFSPSTFATGIMYAATESETADKLPAYLEHAAQKKEDKPA